MRVMLAMLTPATAKTLIAGEVGRAVAAGTALGSCRGKQAMDLDRVTHPVDYPCRCCGFARSG